MVERLSINLVANPNKVILQNFDVGEKRSKILIEKVLNMDDNHCKESVNHNLKLFEARHPNYKEQLLKNFQTIYEKYDFNKNISEFKRLLIGSYFSKEYSIQSAALFNPSIVRHPDQSDITDGDLKFIMSLRATGEGHISSIVFRSGILDRRRWDGVIENQCDPIGIK